MEFSHLHGNSTFSFLEAIGTPKEIIDKAKELGFKNIAITDFGGMYGAIDFYETAKREGINPILGTELGFVLDINGYNKIENIGNISLLAKDIDGYNSLMKIISHANQEGISGKPKLDIDMLGKYNKGIIAFMGGKISWIGKMIHNGDKNQKIIEILKMIQDKLGEENVFLEVVARNEAQDENLKKVNKRILEIANISNIKCITNNIYHYVNKKDKETWEMALAIKDGHKMYDNDRRKPEGEFHIMTGDEIMNILVNNGYDKDLISKRIQNNNRIAESINIKIPMGQKLFPNYNTPEDIKKVYKEVSKDLVSN